MIVRVILLCHSFLSYCRINSNDYGPSATSAAAMIYFGGELPSFNNVLIENCAGYAFAGIFVDEIFSSAKTTVSVKNCAKGGFDLLTFGYTPLTFANLNIQSVNFDGIRVKNALQYNEHDLAQLESTIIDCGQERQTVAINITVCKSIFRLTVFPPIVLASSI